MYLSKLILKDFRSFDNCAVQFHEHLTVLVGENSGGKSNVVDAIRLMLAPATGRRDLFAEKTDIRRGPACAGFTLEATFSGLSRPQSGMLISLISDPSQSEAVVALEFGCAVDDRFVTRLHAASSGAPPEPGAMDLIRCVYLPPLRDAQRSLASGNPGRVATLIRHFLDDGERWEDVAKNLRPSGNDEVLTRVNAAVQNLMIELTGGVREQRAELGFSDCANINEIARDLRFRLSDAGMDLEDMSMSGLGYANLLYMTTVAVELSRARDADLTVFLVEEPEAHLHPQLQQLVLDFLLERAKRTAVRRGTGPEGRIQVVVTTHSPNLTAWVHPSHLVVIRSRQAMTGTRYASACIPIASLGIGPKELDKVDRYLDVTRSALLFGGRYLLVEGIAEAILMPLFARKILDENVRLWKRFQGATVVPVGGVDFEPYLRILLGRHNGHCIGDRVVVLTDGDPHMKVRRVPQLIRIARDLNSEGLLSVYDNSSTLEAELWNAGNERLLEAAFMDLFPGSGEDWSRLTRTTDPRHRPQAFIRLLTRKRAKKGDFAQRFAHHARLSWADLCVPPYIVAAVERVVAP